MTSLTQDRMTIAFAIALPCAVALWLFGTASAAVPSTYMFIALLAIGTAFIGFNAWNNGQAAGSIGQVIHEADTALHAHPAERTRDVSTRRWDAWLARGDRLAYTGRVRALLVFSIVMTGVVFFYVWRA